MVVQQRAGSLSAATPSFTRDYLGDLKHLRTCCEVSFYVYGYTNLSTQNTLEGSSQSLARLTMNLSAECTVNTPAWNSSLHLIKTIVFLSVNNTLNAVKDEALKGLADILQTINPQRRFVELISKYDLYWLVHQILNLQTVATDIFAGNLLPLAVDMSDEKLVRFFFRGNVP